MREWTIPLFGKEISCVGLRLDAGLLISVTGGDEGHVGAISTCDCGKEPKTLEYPGHKEQDITEHWAKALAEAAGIRTVVVGGIHYDNATPEQIAEIMELTEALLEDVCRWAKTAPPPEDNGDGTVSI